jgi:hypothetical protein
VVVAPQDSLRIAVRVFITGELPDDDTLVCGTLAISSGILVSIWILTARCSQDHVRVLRRRGNGSDPSCVALKTAEEAKTLRHVNVNVNSDWQLLAAVMVAKQQPKRVVGITLYSCSHGYYGSQSGPLHGFGL